MLYRSLRLKPIVLSRFRLIRDDLTAWIQHNVVSAGCWFLSLTVRLNSTVFSAQQQLVKTAPSNISLPVLVLKGGKGEIGRKVYFCPLSHVTRAIDKIEEHWEEGLYNIGFEYRLLEKKTNFLGYTRFNAMLTHIQHWIQGFSYALWHDTWALFDGKPINKLCTWTVVHPNV